LGASQQQSTRVVAAAADIKLGTVLAATNLTTIDISGPAPKGAIMKPEQAIGRGVISDLYQGEPILESRLASVGSGGGLAATIPDGMHVDVLVSGTPPGQNNAPGSREAQLGTLVKTILQNIQVLSAGVNIQKDAEGKPQPVQVVNLLVTPEQAETLSLATNGVKIQLVLRNPLDTKTDPVQGTAMGNIFADQNIAPLKTTPAVVRHVKKAVPPPAVDSIEIINGTKRTVEKFSSPEAKQ